MQAVAPQKHEVQSKLGRMVLKKSTSIAQATRNWVGISCLAAPDGLNGTRTFLKTVSQTICWIWRKWTCRWKFQQAAKLALSCSKVIVFTLTWTIPWGPTSLVAASWAT